MHSVFLPTKSGSNANARIVITAPRTKPVSEWPRWAKMLARRKRDGEAGIGDTILRMIGKDRSDRFKAWFKRWVGVDCGCSDRQNWLNRQYPYSNPPLS